MNPPAPLLSEAPPLRVLVIEPEPVVRLGLRSLLDQAPAFRICAEAATVAEAGARWVESDPEVAVFDPDLDGGGGWDLLHRLTHARPPVRCLAWLHSEDAARVERALRTGACGVVLRSESGATVLEALVMAAVGLPDLSGRSTRLLAAAIVDGILPGSAASQALAGRPAQVFRLLGGGLSPREIATRLGIAVRTVQTHIFRLRRSLGASSLADLRRRAAASAVSWDHCNEMQDGGRRSVAAETLGLPARAQRLPSGRNRKSPPKFPQAAIF